MQKQVLVIGDVMLDRYVYGTVNRMSPEAEGVPVLDVEKEESFLGGAGITASTLAALGASVSFLTVVGGNDRGEDDDGGKQVRKLLAGLGIGGKSSVETERGRKTTVKSRFVNKKNGFRMLLRADSETRNAVSAETEKNLLVRLESAAKGAGFIVISDYAKGMLTKKLIEGVLEFARKNNKAVVVDTKGDIRAYEGGNVILVPNLHELAGASGRKINNDDDAGVKSAALALSKSNGSVVVVKRSGKGASIAKYAGIGGCKSGEFRTYPSVAVKGEVVNVSGAGDIFVAVFSLALASGKNIDEAVRLANKGCAKAIAKPHPSLAKDELPELE